uniref:Ketoacyl-synt_C domain-containing protein n=1 Tax=Steinernema glaseri TaxID=37863 RepID=A0A1I8A046_9BILA
MIGHETLGSTGARPSIPAKTIGLAVLNSILNERKLDERKCYGDGVREGYIRKHRLVQVVAFFDRGGWFVVIVGRSPHGHRVVEEPPLCWSHREEGQGKNPYDPQSIPDRSRASPQVEIKIEEMSVRRASWRALVNRLLDGSEQGREGTQALSMTDLKTISPKPDYLVKQLGLSAASGLCGEDLL